MGDLQNTLLDQLLLHVIHGEQAEAEAILNSNIYLLLKAGFVIDYSDRPIYGTAYQLALGAEDIEMCDMLSRKFDLLKSNNGELIGEVEKKRQIKAQFPNGIKDKKHEFRFAELCDAITYDPFDYYEPSETTLKELNSFHDYFKPDPNKIITTGKHFNMRTLIDAMEAFEYYRDGLIKWDYYKFLFFWQHVIGYLQRLVPACYAQAFCQGLYYLTQENKPLNRKLSLGQSFFFPLDSNPKAKLGFDFAVYSYEKGRVEDSYPHHISGGLEQLKNYFENKHKSLEKLTQVYTQKTDAEKNDPAIKPDTQLTIQKKVSTVTLHQWTLIKNSENSSLGQSPSVIAPLSNKPIDQLLLHVLHGDQEKAERMLNENSQLLLEIGEVYDYSGHRIKGTALQCALGALDILMCRLLEIYFDRVINQKGELIGRAEIVKQFNAQFPNGIQNKTSDYDFSKLVNAIKIDPFTNGQANAATQAVIEEFRKDFKPSTQNIITTDKHFNLQHLIQSMKIYANNVKSWKDEQSTLFWIQVIGYLQRFIPACDAQALCQGICDAEYKLSRALEEREKRMIRFPRQLECEQGVVYFPLDSKQNWRLGFDFAVMTRTVGESRGECTASKYPQSGGSVNQAAFTLEIYYEKKHKALERLKNDWIENSQQPVQNGNPKPSVYSYSK